MKYCMHCGAEVADAAVVLLRTDPTKQEVLLQLTMPQVLVMQYWAFFTADSSDINSYME